MIIADGRVILDFLYAKYAHIENLHSVCKLKKRSFSDKRRFVRSRSLPIRKCFVVQFVLIDDSFKRRFIKHADLISFVQMF